jgi:hypothetical protein
MTTVFPSFVGTLAVAGSSSVFPFVRAVCSSRSGRLHIDSPSMPFRHGDKERVAARSDQQRRTARGD